MERRPEPATPPTRSSSSPPLGPVRKIKLTSTAITADVTLAHDDKGEFSLSATLSPRIGGVDQDTAQELADAAHQICPYSKATRGNVEVRIHATAE